MLHEALQSAIKVAVVSTLAPLHVDDVNIVEGEDYDSNDVLFVTINLPGDAARIPGEQFLRTMNAVSEILLKSGDERSPYFRTLRAGETEQADDEADALS